MRIRTKLIVLVACVTALPLLVSAGAGVIVRRERLASGPVSQNNFPSFRMWLDQQLLASWHLRLDDGTLPIDVPEGLELVALDCAMCSRSRGR